MSRAISDLTVKAQTACRLFLAECEKQGLKVLVTETYRTQARQNELYEQGRTKPGNVVTWTKNSRHTNRRAWDICQNIKGKEYSDTGFFKRCGEIAKDLGIIWGGTWKTPDMPHFEIDTDWNEKEADAMTQAEKQEMEALRKRVEELEKNTQVYHYTQDLPDYARPIVQELLDRKIFNGKADDDLALSEDMMRMLVINYNAGLYN